MNRSGAPTYTQNSKTQRISATLFRWCPIFSFFSSHFLMEKKQGLWCPCYTYGAPDRYVMPLTSLWCPWQACDVQVPLEGTMSPLTSL